MMYNPLQHVQSTPACTIQHSSMQLETHDAQQCTITARTHTTAAAASLTCNTSLATSALTLTEVLGTRWSVRTSLPLLAGAAAPPPPPPLPLPPPPHPPPPQITGVAEPLLIAKEEVSFEGPMKYVAVLVASCRRLM